MKNIAFLPQVGRLPLALDLVERAISATFFGFFAYRLLQAYISTGSAIFLLLLFSECLVVVFILIRHTTSAVSLNPLQWCVAIAGTSLPMLVEAGGQPLVSDRVTVALMLMGIGINIWAKLSLRRSFGVVAANRGVKTRGPYGFIRHPMYFGYVVTQLGFILYNPTAWNLAIYTAALALQVLRVSAEEAILFEDTKYRVYAGHVRYRLIPGVF